jgi:hypothetical protein
MTADLAILIPLHRDLTLDGEEYKSVRNTINRCANRVIYFVMPRLSHLNFHVVQSLIDEFQVRISLWEDQHFVRVEEYSKLLLKPEFYRSFNEYSHIAIVQTDVWIFQDDFDRYKKMGYSFIGGLVFEGWYKKTSWRIDHLLAPINGGLSLRNVSDFLNLLNSNENLGLYFLSRRIYFLIKKGRCSFFQLLDLFRTQRIRAYAGVAEFNEDVVLYYASLKEPRFTIPKCLDVKFFCWDTAPWVLMNAFNKLPMAAHAYYRNDFPYEGNYLFWRKYCK